MAFDEKTIWNFGLRSKWSNHLTNDPRTKSHTNKCTHTIKGKELSRSSFHVNHLILSQNNRFNQGHNYATVGQF